jgi:rod shape-determining protein MreC
MSQLIQLFFKFRNFLLFLFLEIICFYLIVQSNHYWDVSYFNTSNQVAGKMLETQKASTDYLNLKDVNAALAIQNKDLLTRISALEQKNAFTQSIYKVDSAFANRFQYIVAKAVNNSTDLSDNYVTIDKGTADGVQAGMGVITSTGVVGRVKTAKEHWSLVYSVLHSKFQISGKLKQASEIGTLVWDGVNPRIINLDAVSKFKKIKIGDSVLTSEFNVIFPPNTMVGRVKSVSSTKEQAFHNIKIELSTDFPNLSFVYIINNVQKPEQDKIEEGLNKQAVLEK